MDREMPADTMQSYMLMAECSLPASKLKLQELAMTRLEILLAYLMNRRICKPDLTQALT